MFLNIDKQQSSFFNDITHIADVRDVEAMKRELTGFDLVVLLAAEHRDDVTPVSLYYDVNVDGMKNVLAAMDYNGIKRIVFTSSVAIYGLNKNNPNEEHPADPFNHYGKTKWEAEKLLQAWAKKNPDVNVNILRPTVIFGERNRGNVYNLLKQISSGRFLMVVSRSMVARVSIPTIAVTSIPPLITNFCRYSDRASLSRKRSNM